MKAEKKSKRKIRAAQIIIPPAAAALALTGCSDTGGGGSDDNDTDNVIDGASFTTPVTVAGLPGLATGFSSYKVFQPALADVDGDGDLDIFAGTFLSSPSSSSSSSSSTTQKVLFFKNATSGSMSFNENSSLYDTLPSDSASGAVYLSGPMYTAVSDIDGNSDIDLATVCDQFGSGGPANDIVTYTDNGSKALTSHNQTSFLSSVLSVSNYTAAIALKDLDGDGDSDLVLGVNNSSTAKVFCLKNNGNGTFSSAGITTLASLPTPSSEKDVPVPSFADLDNDGDQDMFVVTYDTGAINYYENTGSKTSPAFTSRSDSFNLTPPGGVKWFPAFGDMDGDGDLDAMIGTSDGKILYAENIDIE